METAASNKFANQRCGRQVLTGNGAEQLKEILELACLGILRTVLGNLLQDRSDHILNDRNLKYHGRIEHGIGIFLIWEYPLFLAGADRCPAPDGILSGVAAVFVVACYTAQQTVVGCGDIVVIVQQDGGEC